MKLAILAMAAAAISAGQPFPIAGVLVDAQSGSPLNRGHVILTGGRSGEQSIVTGEDGRFAFEAPQGRYGLIAERRGSRQTFGNAGPSSGFGSAIITSPTQDTGHLVFRWFAPGAIFGRVVDDRGEPVENATVQVIRESIVVGRKRVAAFTYARTDDLGNYRIGPIAGGTYYLVASAEPWYVKQLSMLARMRAGEPGQPAPQDSTYAPSYYPNATDLRAAAPLILNPGAEAEVDFALRTVIGANVRAVCQNATPATTNAQPNPLPRNLGNGINSAQLNLQANLPPNNRCAGSVNLYLHAVGDVETLFNTTYTGASDLISGVPPGRYTVRYSGTGGSMRKIIDVTGGDVTVELAALRAPSVSGTVGFKNPGAKPRATMYLRLVNEATGAAIARAIEPDGSFSWQSVAPGLYRPQIGGADGFFISGIAARGADLKNGVIDVIDGASVLLQMVASDETGRLRGFVMDGDKPVPGTLVVLAPRAGSTDPYDYRGFQTELDGSFDFLNVRAGDYVLFTASRFDLEYANPEAVLPYLTGGKPIVIAPHGTYTENIPATIGAAQK
jgi:hypothetical protein